MGEINTQSSKSITEKAQQHIAEALSPGDRAIDATVGNGNDTFFLASTVGPEGRVIGLDIQELALHRATVVLGEAQLLQRVRLMQRSHHRMADWVPADWVGRVRGIMFNLGYLPRGDKSIITRADTTIPALDSALELLAPGGRMTIVVYPGHEGGDEEAEAIRKWLKSLSPVVFEVELILSDTPGDEAPELFVIGKLY